MDVPEMVERMARALCEADACDPDHQSSDPFDEGKRLWTLYVPDARAAIEAMMEPTEAMCAADAGTSTTDRLAWNRAMFRAMLSEALSPSLKEQDA